MKRSSSLKRRISLRPFEVTSSHIRNVYFSYSSWWDLCKALLTSSAGRAQFQLQPSRRVPHFSTKCLVVILCNVTDILFLPPSLTTAIGHAISTNNRKRYQCLIQSNRITLTCSLSCFCPPTWFDLVTFLFAPFLFLFFGQSAGICRGKLAMHRNPRLQLR
jgi:hypothetical protein